MHSGFEDLVVGAQQVVLYENGEFYLELGLGGQEGTYRLEKDTIKLSYFEKPEGNFWPDKILMTQQDFVILSPQTSAEVIKISRNL